MQLLLVANLEVFLRELIDFLLAGRFAVGFEPWLGSLDSSDFVLVLANQGKIKVCGSFRATNLTFSGLLRIALCGKVWTEPCLFACTASCLRIDTGAHSV